MYFKQQLWYKCLLSKDKKQYQCFNLRNLGEDYFKTHA